MIVKTYLFFNGTLPALIYAARKGNAAACTGLLNKMGAAAAVDSTDEVG